MQRRKMGSFSFPPVRNGVISRDPPPTPRAQGDVDPDSEPAMRKLFKSAGPVTTGENANYIDRRFKLSETVKLLFMIPE